MSKTLRTKSDAIKYLAEMGHLACDRIEHLETELAEARAEIERLALEIENKQYTITCASEEHQQLKESLAEARAEIERLRSRNKILDTAIAEMTEEQAALCAEEQSITELVATKNKLIEQMREALTEALQSADSEWENKNLGHDWKYACEQMRAALAAERGE